MIGTNVFNKSAILWPLIATGLMVATPCAAEPGSGWTREVSYTADIMGVVSGGSAKAGRYLDNLDFIVNGDLEKVMGWRGATLHLYLLNNSGGEPNALAGTLQGIDNIEVPRPHARLYELWIEQEFGSGNGSILVGLYDLNSEFYATEASSLLIAPPFGIGSELAATGRNGPSIFPSTALAVRARVGDPSAFHLKVAALNAEASTWGDPDGVDSEFENGILTIAEGGWGGPARVVLGAWRYSDTQDDIRAIATTGEPAQRDAQGAYVLTEGLLHENSAGRSIRGFFRAGLSDGDTTDFQGGLEAGIRVDRVLASRPDSAFSIGLHQGIISEGARENFRDDGLNASRSETGLEVTYSDKLGRVTVQPDLQLIRHPGGDKGADDVVVVAIRMTIDLL